MPDINSFSDIIDLWPSKAAFAQDLGITPQAANNMASRNRIASVYWNDLISAAKRHGHEITPESLLSLDAQNRRSSGAPRTAARIGS